MAHGKVKWFNSSKGFGFILADDGREVYVDHAALAASGRKSLREGEPVEFEIQEGAKGPRAIKVKAKS